LPIRRDTVGRWRPTRTAPAGPGQPQRRPRCSGASGRRVRTARQPRRSPSSGSRSDDVDHGLSGVQPRSSPPNHSDRGRTCWAAQLVSALIPQVFGHRPPLEVTSEQRADSPRRGVYAGQRALPQTTADLPLLLSMDKGSRSRIAGVADTVNRSGAAILRRKGSTVNPRAGLESR
jgi:hypothetical protein